MNSILAFGMPGIDEWIVIGTIGVLAGALLGGSIVAVVMLVRRR